MVPAQIGRGLREFDLRGLNRLAGKFDFEEFRAGFHGLAGLGVDLGDDAGDARRDAAIAFAGPVDDDAGNRELCAVFARRERAGLEREVPTAPARRA